MEGKNKRDTRTVKLVHRSYIDEVCRAASLVGELLPSSSRILSIFPSNLDFSSVPLEVYYSIVMVSDTFSGVSILGVKLS